MQNGHQIKKKSAEVIWWQNIVNKTPSGLWLGLGLGLVICIMISSVPREKIHEVKQSEFFSLHVI